MLKPGIDMIAVGPTVPDPHTVNERCNTTTIIKEDTENYGERELKALGGGLKARYGSDKDYTNAFGSYKFKELADVKYVEIVGEPYNENFASLVSNGSLIIISVIAGISIITVGVFMTLYFKQKKKAGDAE